MDSTPLLSAVGGLPGPTILQDHPAFLRASHSPWKFIPQNVLVILRGFVLAYLTAVAAMTINYELSEKSDFSQWRHVYNFSLISFVLVFIYHVITFSWTFTHLYYPHPDDTEGTIESYIVSAMSLPRNMGSLRKQFYFTMFFTTSVVFAFMNSTVYWFITRQLNLVPGDGNHEAPPPEATGQPKENGAIWGWDADTSLNVIPDAPFSDLFGEDWFKAFIIVNLYAVISFIMVLEILFFNSIKRPLAIGRHLLGLMLFSGVYLGWAAIGKVATKWVQFDWLDVKKIGSEEAVSAYCIGFVLLAPFMYTLMLGFIALREGLTKSLARARVAAIVEAEDTLGDN